MKHVVVSPVITNTYGFTLTSSSARTDFSQSIATLWVLCDIWSIQEVQSNFPKFKALNDKEKESEATMELLTSVSLHCVTGVEERAPLHVPHGRTSHGRVSHGRVRIGVHLTGVRLMGVYS
jgi:hypothetical protein